MKLSKEEEKIISDIRNIKRKLKNMWPGSIVVHLDSGGNIRKHEFHLAPINQILLIKKEIRKTIIGPRTYADEKERAG